ncbi:cyclic lactone autoinducer peptide [Ruminococcus bromii]|jgi:cyclic lactone autoinducer peptide
MKKNIFKKVAMICSSFFTLMLVIGANSNSTMMMHQEKAPEEIKRFSKIR